MKYKFKDITASYTREKKRRSSFWARLVSRPLSFGVTYLLINLGFSANAVSVISMVDAIVACVLIILGGKYVYWGVGLFVFWHVLDCVDGNIARAKKESSYGGAFLDAVSGYMAPAFIYLSVGVNAYLTTSIESQYTYLLIVFGGFASVSDILSRVIYQKYLVTECRLGLIGNTGDIDQVRSNGLAHICDWIMKQMGYSSMFMPLLIVATIAKRCDVLILLYFLYTVAVLLASLVYFCKKAQTLNQRVDASSITDIIEF